MSVSISKGCQVFASRNLFGQGVPTRNKNKKIGAGVKLHGGTKYPFKQLEVGQSFFVRRSTTKYTNNTDLQDLLCGLACRHKRRLNHQAKFATRVGLGGVRVWRVS